MNLEGSNAVITGGGNGIGRAIALALAEEGVNVVVGDIELAAAQETAGALASAGVKSHAVRVDVTREADIIRLADEAWATLGSVNLLFNNAGVIADRKPLWEFTADDVRWVVSVNLEGILNGIRIFTPRFIEAGGPSWIVNTGSEHSLGMPHTMSGIYTATKHAVLGLSDVLRHELPDHIGVSVLCPGVVDSTLWKSAARRQDEVGGAETVGDERGAFLERFGMPAAEVAARTLRGIREGEFLIPTHAHVISDARARWELVEAAFTGQAPRYDGDDRYDLATLFQHLARRED